MPNCYDCKYVYSECEDWCWYITCEKGLETSDFDNDCKSFEQKEEIKSDIKSVIKTDNFVLENSKREIFCKLVLIGSEDFNFGDTFILRSIEYGTEQPITIEIEKVRKCNE